MELLFVKKAQRGIKEAAYSSMDSSHFDVFAGKLKHFTEFLLCFFLIFAMRKLQLKMFYFLIFR